MTIAATATTPAGSARSVLDTAWRVLAIALVFTVLDRLMAGRPSLSPAYLQGTAINLVTGAGYVLVMLPLARRLPYRRGVRFLAIFAPLYWIALLGNLVEAWFDTTLPRRELVFGAVVLAIPIAVVALLVALLLPAAGAEPQPPIHALLGRRPLLSWAWRILLAGVLFAILLQVMGTLWGPVISRYYHDPAFMAQSHTLAPGPFVAWPEETFRGVVFMLVLLPLVAVMRGRDWRSLLALAACVALVDAALEGWLAMLASTTWPTPLRLGEAGDLTSDAIVRGIVVAGLLALPREQPASTP